MEDGTMLRTVLALTVLMLCAGGQCSAGGDAAVHKYFPECFDETIGASSGARCRVDNAEWFIVFWHGWDDCPAGCINKVEDAWYKIDGAAKIWACDKEFKNCHEIKPEQIVRGGGGQATPSAAAAKPAETSKPPANAKPPAPPQPDEKGYCQAHDECFWYECCDTQPMSRRYSKKHYQELYLGGPDQQTCFLKCMAPPPPADERLACVYSRCMGVGKDAPAIDPKRPVVWVGRSIEIGQCQDPAQVASPLLSAGPPVLKRAFTEPVPAGPKFSAGIGAAEKKARDADPNRFTCKACDVCKTLAREYVLVYFDDLPQLESGPEGWKRVDE
jgi:hypothetical protein